MSYKATKRSLDASRQPYPTRQRKVQPTYACVQGRWNVLEVGEQTFEAKAQAWRQIKPKSLSDNEA